MDPAAGTGGFLLAAYEQMKSPSLDPDEKRFLRNEALRGWEIVDATARLCAMNLLLHGISAPESPSLITVDDSLRSTPPEHFDMVLTNPPFGRKSSYKVVNALGETELEDMSYLREDFWATTSNKQLNFLQHVRSLLKINGRAAIVVPDNVLFEGGAGETIRRRLLEQCDVHTLLRLPTGIFYAGGVKANVLFFNRKPPSEKPWTDKLWIYDFRTNQNFTLKTGRPLALPSAARQEQQDPLGVQDSARRTGSAGHQGYTGGRYPHGDGVRAGRARTVDHRPAGARLLDIPPELVRPYRRTQAALRGLIGVASRSKTG